MRTRLVLILWLIGLIFPMAWLGRFSTSYRSIFNTIFGPEWVHVVMHLALFTVLGIFLGASIRLNLDRGGIMLILAIVFGVGVLQESFQLFSQGIDPFYSVAQARAGFDLGVDLAGGLLGLGILVTYKSKLAGFIEFRR
jgi:hypothetical protein